MTVDLLSRRRIASALLGAGLTAPGLARASSPSEPVVVAAVPLSKLTPDKAIETSVDPYSRMTAPVMLNGKGPYYFVLDTGANQSVVSQELALMLDLPPGQPVTLHGVAAAEPAPTAVVARVEVGGRLERDVTMPVLPQAAIGAPGILGIDRLHNQRLKLDFRARRLTVERSHWEDTPPYTTVVQARQRFGQLTIVDADLAGIPVAAFLDSGAQRTIGNPALLQLATLRLPKDKMFEVPIISVTGRVIPGEIALLPVLRLGKVRLIDISVTFADLHVFQIWGLEKPAILLGMDGLSVFDSVSIDFGRSEVWFELYPKR
jgi:hypothetical protein